MGFAIADGQPEPMMSHFPRNSLGVIEDTVRNSVQIFLPGQGESYMVSAEEIGRIDIDKTGDEHPQKICNVCFVLKNTGEFAINSKNAQGPVRRPSCKQCRLDIDRRNMTKQAREEALRNMPPQGTLWRCPICRKWSIVGVTKIVIDHDHREGKVRGYLCDSCNTGLGRFKNGEDFLQNAISYLRQAENRRGQRGP